MRKMTTKTSPETVNVQQAKTHLSRLLARVERGEEIVIARSGRPVARLLPFEPADSVRVLGGARGQVWIAEDSDAPLSGKTLADLEGRENSR
jgi:prevent-host-death family protein